MDSTSEVSAESARLQVDKILASRRFANSQRHSRLLRFVLQQMLQSHCDRLKEYILGIEVFDRKESFDPQTDPIVRVEMFRIRAKLKEYYENEGQSDPILLEFPKGSYIPLFQRRRPSAVATSLPAGKAARMAKRIALVIALSVAGLGLYGTWSPRKRVSGSRPAHPVLSSLAVLPFVSLGPRNDVEYFADGLTGELTAHLANVGGLHVASLTSAFQFKRRTDDVRRIGAQLGVQAILAGTIRVDGSRLRVTAELVNINDGYSIRSITREFDYKDPLRLQDHVAQKLLTELGLRSLAAR